MNADGMGDSGIALECLLDRFRSNEAPIVASIFSQLAGLKISEGKIIQNFIIKAQDLYSRLQQAGNS